MAATDEEEEVCGNRNTVVLLYKFAPKGSWRNTAVRGAGDIAVIRGSGAGGGAAARRHNSNNTTQMDAIYRQFLHCCLAQPPAWLFLAAGAAGAGRRAAGPKHHADGRHISRLFTLEPRPHHFAWAARAAAVQWQNWPTNYHM